MAYNLQDYKIPTYPNVNSNPSPPTTTKGGNGSHLIQVYNAQIDAAEAALNELEYGVGLSREINSSIQSQVDTLASMTLDAAQNSAWTVITNSNASCNTRASLVLIAPNDATAPVTLSLTFNEQIGDSVELLNASGIDWNVDVGQNKYRGAPKPTRLYLPGNSYQAVKLVYTGFDFGYVPTGSNILVVEP